jgi:hypothetical protein
MLLLLILITLLLIISVIIIFNRRIEAIEMKQPKSQSEHLAPETVKTIPHNITL